MGNFQTSKSFNIRERQYRCLRLVIKLAGNSITTMGGVSSILRSERNNICVANVSDQSARTYIHRIEFQIILQLTWRCCCYCLKSIIPNMRIPGGKIYELWTLLFGKVFTSKFVGPGTLSYKKKNLPGRGLTKVEKHCCRMRKLRVVHRYSTLSGSYAVCTCRRFPFH
jgi:hypothetical protein